MKFCGKRGSRSVYFKEELIRMATERLRIEEKSARNMTKTQLCELLGIQELKNTPVKIHTEKVCSEKKTKGYPNRYSKEELADLIIERKLSRLPKAKLMKLNILMLCGLARLPFTDIPVLSDKKKPKKKETGFVVGPKEKTNNGTEETKESADCITRSSRRPFKHQLRVIEHFKRHRGLVAVHSLGSGKTLTAVLASQCYLDEFPRHKVIVISPTTLIENFKKEMVKYGDIRHPERYEFYSFQGFYYKNKKSPPNCKNTFLIVDEAHNLRTQYKKTPKKEIGKFTKAVIQCAKKANRVLLLTATPIVNKPGDVASLLDLIREPRDKTELKSNEIDKNCDDEAFVRQIARCKFSFYTVDRETEEQHYPAKKDYSIYLPMQKQFQEAYNRVENDVMEDEVVMSTFGEAQLKKFFNGIRRAVNILSGLPEDELVKSPKVKWIIEEIKKNPGKKTVVFSHFLDMGLKAIQKRLPANIKSDYITGSKSKTKRAQIVKDYNDDKLDVLFISKAGGEGIDLKGTRRMILLESGWNENTEEQVIGRGRRYGSHSHLPPEERLVEVYHLYHIKPEERQQVLDLLHQKKIKNIQDIEIFDKYMKKLLDEYNYKQSLESPDLWLSADLMLRKISLEKQKKILSFLKKLRDLSIENQEDC